MKFEFLFYFVFAAIVGSFAWRYFKNGSLSGAMLGGKIQRELGEIELKKSMGVSQVLRVAVMEASDGERFVGVSVVSKAALGAGMVPFRLSRAQASELARLLEVASRE